MSTALVSFLHSINFHLEVLRKREEKEKVRLLKHLTLLCFEVKLVGLKESDILKQ